jgi:hypothetical protein
LIQAVETEAKEVFVTHSCHFVACILVCMPVFVSLQVDVVIIVSVFTLYEDVLVAAFLACIQQNPDHSEACYRVEFYFVSE